MTEIKNPDDQNSPGAQDDGLGGTGNGNGDNRGVKRPRVSTAADDDDDDDDKPGRERRKIDIKFIQDKSRRHITFSKRKAGIMKKVSGCGDGTNRVARMSAQIADCCRHMNCRCSQAPRCYCLSCLKPVLSTPLPPRNSNRWSQKQKERILSRYVMPLRNPGVMEAPDSPPSPDPCSSFPYLTLAHLRCSSKACLNAPEPTTDASNGVDGDADSPPADDPSSAQAAQQAAQQQQQAVAAQAAAAQAANMRSAANPQAVAPMGGYGMTPEQQHHMAYQQYMQQQQQQQQAGVGGNYPMPPQGRMGHAGGAS